MKQFLTVIILGVLSSQVMAAPNYKDYVLSDDFFKSLASYISNQDDKGVMLKQQIQHYHDIDSHFVFGYASRLYTQADGLKRATESNVEIVKACYNSLAVSKTTGKTPYLNGAQKGEIEYYNALLNRCNTLIASSHKPVTKDMKGVKRSKLATHQYVMFESDAHLQVMNFYRYGMKLDTYQKDSINFVTKGNRIDGARFASLVAATGNDEIAFQSANHSLTLFGTTLSGKSVVVPVVADANEMKFKIDDLTVYKLID